MSDRLRRAEEALFDWCAWLESECAEQIARHPEHHFTGACLSIAGSSMARFLMLYREYELANLAHTAANCPDCATAGRHAWSDATTPGFFFTECGKHREQP